MLRTALRRAVGRDVVRMPGLPSPRRAPQAGPVLLSERAYSGLPAGRKSTISIIVVVLVFVAVVDAVPQSGFRLRAVLARTMHIQRLGLIITTTANDSSNECFRY